MNIVKLSLESNRPQERVDKALEISHWLQGEYGLVREKDFDWFFMSTACEVHFRFFDDNEAVASFMLMKWV
jgi:hypothetical protein